jgi:hypothetical protein
MTQETLEEAAEKMYKQSYDEFGEPTWDEGKLFHRKQGFIKGALWQQERMYSEEDMINFAFDTYCYISILMKVPFNKISENKLHAMYNFENFKKELL